MENFTPYSALAGGLLIGLAASLLLLANGRIAGISGIVAGAVVRSSDARAWRLVFLAGLAAGGLAIRIASPQPIPVAMVAGTPAILVAGVLVGFGTRLASGCTSGHAVCGVARLSPRSLAATATFMLTGALTVFAIRHLLGGA